MYILICAKRACKKSFWAMAISSSKLKFRFTNKISLSASEPGSYNNSVEG
jgi:hypothetical protein